MTSSYNARQKTTIGITAVLVAILLTWTIANWSDFRSGFEEGYQAQAGSKP